jgi:hypothetical protein
MKRLRDFVSPVKSSTSKKSNLSSTPTKSDDLETQKLTSGGGTTFLGNPPNLLMSTNDNSCSQSPSPSAKGSRPQTSDNSTTTKQKKKPWFKKNYQDATKRQ